MASGSALSVSGGFTMTHVVSGDVCDDADYDNMKNCLSSVEYTSRPHNRYIYSQ